MSSFLNIIINLLLSISLVFALEERQDSLADFPTYDKVYKLVSNTTLSIETAWEILNNLTKEELENQTIIYRKIWPKLLSKFHHAHNLIKEMDMDIIFRRRPSSFLDALLNINSHKKLDNLAKKPDSEPYGYVKLRWMEISTISTQIHRFYNKRMRDIFNGGTNMYEVMNSLHNYRGFVWSSSLRGSGSFEPVKYNFISEFVFNKLFFEDGNDAFDGLKKLMDMQPEVLSKPQYDPNSCGPGQRYIRIEPNGNDIPYYLLFYLCLVDLKYYILSNAVFAFNQLFYNQQYTNQTFLTETMDARIKKKVQLFDDAFGKNLASAGPQYSTYPGITTCDPPPVSEISEIRAFEHGISYEKLTNFIKVFVSPEQKLHKSGTCRVTCDLLDATYSVCPKNDTDCIMERERECFYHPSRCEKFNPVCPTGAYQCQNSSGQISACPSTRFDRLYEYVIGQDVDEGFHFGLKNHTCNESIEVWKGGWKMEEDILVNTPHFCEICVCYCFEPMVSVLGNETTRYFSLKSIRANIKENRIIIGIKFVRLKDQIHLAVADAVALPGNRVDLSSIKWNTPKYEEDSKFLQRLNMDLRSLNLDDVVSIELDRVVTGIRFYTETYIGVVQYNYIGIEVLTHKIDVKGNLVNGTGVYVRNNNSTVHRKLYQYPDDPDGPDDPLMGPGPALPDSHSNQYIVFRGSSLEKDAAQSTIPYFDSQPLISPEPKWLKGLGILHKVKHGYGGFLAFKLIEHQF